MNDRSKNRAMAIGPLETLDERLAPSGFGFPGIHVPVPNASMLSKPATPTPTYHPDGSAMDKAGQYLNTIYREYEAYSQGGAKEPFVSTQSGLVKISQDLVGVDVHAAPGNIAAVAQQMKSLGMQVTGVDSTTGTVEGSLPIAQLPTVAGDPFVSSISPIFYPTAYSGGLHHTRPA